MKYTAHQFKRQLQKADTTQLENFKVSKHYREYQFWKREALSIELISPAVFTQKLEYVHFNSLKAGLCMQPEDYHYSSAKFYYNGSDSFNILTLYQGIEEWANGARPALRERGRSGKENVLN